MRHYAFLDGVSYTTAEEERMLAGPARDGCPDARRRLVESISRYVLRVAQRLSRKYGVPADDLFQEGQLAVLAATVHFDPDKARWSTYAGTSAWRRMETAGRRHIRRESQLPAVSLADFPCGGDCLSTADADAADLIDTAAVVGLLDRLEGRERYVIDETYFARRTQADIAGELGVARQRIQQLKDRAVARLGRIAKEEACASPGPAA